ncbi:MAG: hypothetical protein ABJB21_07695 [bacterium]
MSQSIKTKFPPFSSDLTSQPLREPAKAGQLSVVLSSRRLLVFVFMLVIFTIAARPITDPDFWWHLKTGQYLVETRSIPHTDIFSTVRLGSEWIAHEWGSEIFMYAIYRALGYGGLIIAFAMLIAMCFWIAYRRCQKHAPHPYVAGFAVILGAIATLPTWGVRPQIFSIFFASIFLGILDSYSHNQKNRAIWWLVPLLIVWTNMHAGFAVGIAFIMLTMFGVVLDGLLLRRQAIAGIFRALRPIGVVLIGCIVAVCVNPNGVRLFAYPFETLRSRTMMKYIQEWRSPDFHEPMFQALSLMILLTFSALALSKKRARPSEILLLIATGWMTLRSSRNMPFFVLAAMPLLAEHSWTWITSHRWGQWLKKPEEVAAETKVRLKLVLNVLLLVIAPLGLVTLRVQRTLASQSATEVKEYPSAAVDFLQANQLAQPIFNEYAWGGYLIWRLHPEYKVYIDGRADVYGDSMIDEFLDIHEGNPTWRQQLNQRGIRTVLVKPDVPLASLLREDREWHNVFEDKQAVIFVR